VNSINWSRILSQTVYYFYAYFQVQEAVKREGRNADALMVSFSVPTGNFGDILAGYYAKRMGLPISLIVATNENDILHRFFTKGEYHATSVVPTCSPSMDIQVASNFERYLYYLSGCDSARLTRWMDIFHTTKKLTLSGDELMQAKNDFQSYSATQQEVQETILDLYKKEKYLVDPHTSIAVCAANHVKHHPEVVCLATAHPAKFKQTVELALGSCSHGLDITHGAPGIASLLQGNIPTRNTECEPTLQAVKKMIEEILAQSSCGN